MISAPTSETADAGPGSSQPWIACLCADWCGTCRDWQPVLARWAASQPDIHVLWVDIEDEADWLDTLGVDIETFPTLLLAQHERALFLGPVVPQVASVTRLLTRPIEPTHTGTALPDCVQDMAARLWRRQQAQALPRLGQLVD